MTNQVITYGLNEEQQELLRATLPEQYEIVRADSATEMIMSQALCFIISADNLSAKETRILMEYCAETADCANELVVWIGELPPCQTVVHYTSFLSLLMEPTKVIEQAVEHYETFDMYHCEYLALPIREMADALEGNIYAALNAKYPTKPDPAIADRVRREWVAIQEVAAAPELAAVHEMCLWLNRNKIPYYMEGSATSGFIPYLLGIIRVNPLSMRFAGNDAVWQDFCSYGNEPYYIFHLPKDMEARMIDWTQNHWLKQLYPDRWESAQRQYPNRLARLNMQFYFDLEETTDPELPSFCCEDVYYYLLEHDFIEKDAYRGMCRVREGNGLPVVTDEMKSASDSYMIQRCQQVEYLPKRADLMEKKVMAIRLGKGGKTNGTNPDTI